ncbi:MAG: carbohydrate ABC transporter permease [Clostridia bacterium]|nr:carbohydrate ABC transporter permease [Clostridia bacterium]
MEKEIKKIKTPLGERIFNVVNVIIMIGMIVITLYPFLYIVFASFSDSNQMMAHTGLLLKPLGFNLNSYAAVFKNDNILTGYKNTLCILVFGVAINLVLTFLGAYVLSRKDIMLKKPMTIFIIITMFVSGGMIPAYQLVMSLGIDNSYWSLMLPGAINTFNLIIMRTNFEGIPDSIGESAKIDGANDMVLLFKIILPLSLPIIAVIGLYYAVGIWNSWFGAMLYIRDRELYPLQLFLREILIENEAGDMANATDVGNKQAVTETIKYAVIMVSTLPILVLYPFLQKYFVKGTMAGAVKG